MKAAIEDGCLSVEQAVERFRARTVSELRLLNAHLPRSMQLERREIDRLVDDLLSAVRETPKRRNASLLDKAAWMASGVLVHAIRQRSRQRQTAGAMAHRHRWAVHEVGHSKGDSDPLLTPLAQEPFESLGADMTGAEDRNRVA